MSSAYTESLNRLIEEFGKLPGIGPKTMGGSLKRSLGMAYLISIKNFQMVDNIKISC
jgi:recombinational DNA repair protein RecR